MTTNDTDYQLENIQVNYILSKNRSGSTLLSNLLNQHQSILSISEQNIYWLLQKDYGHITTFTPNVTSCLIADLFFLLEISGKYSGFYELNKTELHQKITSKYRNLTYAELCAAICIEGLIYDRSKKKITQILNKELQFNHHLKEIISKSPKTKFIFLIRDPRSVIFSTIKKKMGRVNIAYQAKKWLIETQQFSESKKTIKYILIVNYENLITNPTRTLKDCCSFLGISDKPEILSEESSLQEVLNILKRNKNIPKQILEHLTKRHYSTFSSLDKTKINEWKKKNAFTLKEQEKINFICGKLALKFGYNLPFKKINLSIIDHYYMQLAVFDYFIAKKYLLLPVKYKRVLRALNVFKFYQ